MTESEAGAPVGRRVILGLLGVGTLGVLGGSQISTAVANVLGPIEVHDPTGLVSLLPVGQNFRFYSVASGVKRETAATYRLAVSGLVDRPTSYTLGQLQQHRQTQLTRDFQCVTGWRVPGVHWSGVRLSELLDAAGVQANATAVRFTSFDGTYSESLTLEQARRPDVLVALEMLGKPVTHNHGGPVRLFVAPMYGYKSAKWLSGIEVTAAVEKGYWEHRGYAIDGWVGKSNGRDDAGTSD